MKPTWVFPLLLSFPFAYASPTNPARSEQTSAFQTSADQEVYQRILEILAIFQRVSFPDCADAKAVSSKIVDSKGKKANRTVNEEWTLSGCGKLFIYKLQLVTSPEKGTIISIDMAEDPRVVPA